MKYPDVELATGRFKARQLYDNYIDTREYRALARDALHYMKQDTIDLLVVGLPVAQFLARRGDLERASIGEFEVGRKRKVAVKRALVVAQPQGALYHYAATHGRMREILDERSLVIDAGWRTFDWLVTRGMQVVTRLSHSINRGASDILRDIAEHISADIGTAFGDLEAIDVALRTGRNPRIFQKTYDIRPLDKLVREVAEQAVSAMVQHIDNAYAFENIVLVGGGAFMFKRAVKKAFPRHTINEVREPIYADVRGFQLAGQRLLASQVGAVKPREANALAAAEGGAAQ